MDLLALSLELSWQGEVLVGVTAVVIHILPPLMTHLWPFASARVVVPYQGPIGEVGLHQSMAWSSTGNDSVLLLLLLPHPCMDPSNFGEWPRGRWLHVAVLRARCMGCRPNLLVRSLTAILH